MTRTNNLVNYYYDRLDSLDYLIYLTCYKDIVENLSFSSFLIELGYAE